MHRRLLSVIVLLMIIVGEYYVLRIFSIHPNTHLDNNNIEFCRRVLELCNSGRQCYLEDIVDCAWDRVYVFHAYASRNTKFDAVGYIYDEDISTPNEETTFSMVFMDKDVAVFYVEITPDEYVYRKGSIGYIIEQCLYRNFIDEDVKLLRMYFTSTFSKALRSDKPYVTVYADSENNLFKVEISGESE